MSLQKNRERQFHNFSKKQKFLDRIYVRCQCDRHNSNAASHLLSPLHNILQLLKQAAQNSLKSCKTTKEKNHKKKMKLFRALYSELTNTESEIKSLSPTRNVAFSLLTNLLRILRQRKNIKLHVHASTYWQSRAVNEIQQKIIIILRSNER